MQDFLILIQDYVMLMVAAVLVYLGVFPFGDFKQMWSRISLIVIGIIVIAWIVYFKFMGGKI